MVNQRLTKFWTDIEKLRKFYENGGFHLGIYVIDTKNHAVEINGNSFLKQLLYETSSYINAKWISDSHTPSPATENNEEKERLPETTCWLPYLPPGGIQKMTDKVLKLYWPVVMRAVCPDRKNDLGYETHQYVNA